MLVVAQGPFLSRVAVVDNEMSRVAVSGGEMQRWAVVGSCPLRSFLRGRLMSTPVTGGSIPRASRAGGVGLRHLWCSCPFPMAESWPQVREFGRVPCVKLPTSVWSEQRVPYGDVSPHTCRQWFQTCSQGWLSASARVGLVSAGVSSVCRGRASSGIFPVSGSCLLVSAHGLY